MHLACEVPAGKTAAFQGLVPIVLVTRGTGVRAYGRVRASGWASGGRALCFAPEESLRGAAQVKRLCGAQGLRPECGLFDAAIEAVDGSKVACAGERHAPGARLEPEGSLWQGVCTICWRRWQSQRGAVHRLRLGARQVASMAKRCLRLHSVDDERDLMPHIGMERAAAAQGPAKRSDRKRQHRQQSLLEGQLPTSTGCVCAAGRIQGGGCIRRRKRSGLRGCAAHGRRIQRGHHHLPSCEVERGHEAQAQGAGSKLCEHALRTEAREGPQRNALRLRRRDGHYLKGHHLGHHPADRRVGVGAKHPVDSSVDIGAGGIGNVKAQRASRARRQSLRVGSQRQHARGRQSRALQSSRAGLATRQGHARVCRTAVSVSARLEASQSDFRRAWPSSPITPRRKARTQRTKITPCTIVTQAPSSAR